MGQRGLGKASRTGEHSEYCRCRPEVWQERCRRAQEITPCDRITRSREQVLCKSNQCPYRGGTNLRDHFTSTSQWKLETKISHTKVDRTLPKRKETTPSGEFKTDLTNLQISKFNFCAILTHQSCGDLFGCCCWCKKSS